MFIFCEASTQNMMQNGTTIFAQSRPYFKLLYIDSHLNNKYIIICSEVFPKISFRYTISDYIIYTAIVLKDSTPFLWIVVLDFLTIYFWRNSKKMKQVHIIWCKMAPIKFPHKVGHISWILSNYYEFYRFLSNFSHLNDFMLIFSKVIQISTTGMR